MKKKYLFIAAPIVFAGLIYAMFHNNNAWQTIDASIVEPKRNYLDEPDIVAMIERQLNNVSYAAIVHPAASKTTPNSWFHKKIMGNPYDSTYHLVKANVIHTSLGKEYNSITYASASNLSKNSKPPTATLVLLCGDDPNNLYAPENGYEFSASIELIEYLKKKGRLTPLKQDSSVCP